MAAARAAAEAAMYETASQEMAGHHHQHQQQQQQQQFQQHPHPFDMETYAEQQERGYLETLQQQRNSDQLGVQQANLLQDFLGSSSAKDQSTNELLHLLAQQQGQQGQQNSMEAYHEPDDSINLRPEEHYMTIAQDGKFKYFCRCFGCEDLCVYVCC